MESGVDRDGATMLHCAAPRTDGSLRYEQHVIMHFAVMPPKRGSFLCATECSKDDPRLSHTIKATRGERGICAN